MHSLTVERLGKFYRLKRGKKAAAHDVYARRNPESTERRGQAEANVIWALKDVSFALRPGTILGVIGPNGAGKTTLLKVIARITPPTEGRVVGRGKVVPLLEIGSGFHPDFSGRENVFLSAAMYGIPRHEVLRRFDDIVDFAGIADFIDVPLKRYSSGMYLRLAFSVAVNMEPNILLADEVLAVGDLEFQERCLQRVREVSSSGMTVLFVSHDIQAITRLCHQVLLLNAGQVAALGDAEDVVQQYQRSAWTLIGSRARAGRKGSHVNGLGEILSVRLVSSGGKELGAVRMAHEAGVKITFSVLSPGVRVRCAADLYTRSVHVFRSVQPEELTVETPGVYSAVMSLPGNLLSEAIYTLTAGVALQTPEGTVHPLADYNALTFQVYDNDAAHSARGTYKGRLNGVVSPRLTWSLTRERDVVQS